MAINFIKNIAEKKVDAATHRAFSRYSIGEFGKESFIVKKDKNAVKVYAGFEYLLPMHTFFVKNVAEGDVEINGAIETVHEIDAELQKLHIEFSSKKRHGKSGNKYEFVQQKVASNAYGALLDICMDDYLLFGAKNKNCELKVKSATTPKIGVQTEKFVVLVLGIELFKKFKEEFLFDVDREFKEAVVRHIYFVDKVLIDEKLMEKDPERARREAKRKGKIVREIELDKQPYKKYEMALEA